MSKTVRKTVKGSTDPEQITALRHMLIDAAEQMTDLADKLGNTGRPISQEEYEVIASAMVPGMNARFREVKAAFLSGTHPDRQLQELTNFINLI